MRNVARAGSLVQRPAWGGDAYGGPVRATVTDRQ
ncbi:hypothetical protein BJ996_000860 [Streptomyces phaeogriseichromatogenes]|nr:hypothetical protein [Streptomyces murinus]